MTLMWRGGRDLEEGPLGRHKEPVLLDLLEEHLLSPPKLTPGRQCHMDYVNKLTCCSVVCTVLQRIGGRISGRTVLAIDRERGLGARGWGIAAVRTAVLFCPLVL